MGVFITLGRSIAKAPPLFALLMPIVSLVIIIVGFKGLKIETSVNKIWIPESTSYAANSKYTADIIGGSTTSSFLGISLPRRGGNALKAELLLELVQRLNDTQQTAVTVDDMKFSFEDVCYNPAGPYKYPCFRMHVLDCFAEGGYDWSHDMSTTWRPMVKAQLAARRSTSISDNLPNATKLAVAALYKPIISTAMAQMSCKASCAYDGPPSLLAPALNATPGTWESNVTCVQCISSAYNQSSPATLDFIYVGALQKTFNKSGLTKQAFNKFLSEFPPLVGMVKRQVEAQVDLGIAILSKKIDVSNPYTFRTERSYFSTSRPYLREPSTGKLSTDAEVLAAANDACYAWDGGLALPPNLNTLLYGNPLPSDYSIDGTQKLTSVEALQHVYRLVVPEDLRSRLAERLPKYGGPLKITHEQAEQVLKAYKARFEKSFSAGWDDSSKGNLENTPFFDDAGADGTFARTLSELTTDSVPLIALYAGLTVLLSAVFFISCDCVASQIVLVVIGSLFAIMGCFAALALSALCGISLNVVHFWTMPFIIIGIGIDDMFMLTLSSQTTIGGGTSQAFAQAFANVASPVTMTSLVNAAMFAIMSFTSDIRAVYQAGYTGLMATVILLLTMLLSFSPLVYLDSRRRASLRYEFIPCLRASSPRDGTKTLTDLLSKRIYTSVYKPLVTSRIGRVLLLLASCGMLVTAAVGLTNLKVGLDLHDFFPSGTPEGKFAQDRNTYFPLWPVSLNWGELNYTDPAVQFKMVRQFEDVLSTAHIAGHGVKTSLVWTAAFAEWGRESTTSLACKSVMKENAGLKLKADGGICELRGNTSMCPVFEGLSERQFAQCIAEWRRTSTKYAAISPMLPTNLSDGVTPLLPIRYSTASGSALFAYNLATTDDYTSMIKETRRYLDDDSSSRSWMSGIPFDYWEQYLSIVDVMMTIGGISVLAGFIISFGFIFAELSLSLRGTCVKRLLASTLGAFLIAAASAVSLLTVVGFCGLVGIQLSGFTAISCVMSTGLAVEYSVHVVHRFIDSPSGPALERIHHAMEWLFAPSAMAFLTSAFSVAMMAFSEFRFVRLYFFAPLACAVISSYAFGAFTLPCLLSLMDCMPTLAPLPRKATDIESPNVNAQPEKQAEEPATPLSPCHESEEVDMAKDETNADVKATTDAIQI